MNRWTGGFLVVAAMVLGVWPGVRADERPLALFGVELQGATPGQLDKAITAAGGARETAGAGKVTYSAVTLGLPGARTLETVFFGQQFVLAQYFFGKYNRQDEQLRKMLVAKYGQPAKKGAFDRQYISDGSYTWAFPGGMQLTYKKEFHGQTYLTYLDPAAASALQAHLEEKAAEHAKAAAAKASDAF
jgi:hypothetical protein